MTIISFVDRIALPPRAINSLSPSKTVNFEVVHKKPGQKNEVHNVRLISPANTHKLQKPVFLKPSQNMRSLEVIKGILHLMYWDKTGKVIYQQAVVTEERMNDIIQILHEDIMQVHSMFKKTF